MSYAPPPAKPGLSGNINDSRCLAVQSPCSGGRLPRQRQGDAGAVRHGQRVRQGPRPPQVSAEIRHLSLYFTIPCSWVRLRQGPQPPRGSLTTALACAEGKRLLPRLLPPAALLSVCAAKPGGRRTASTAGRSHSAHDVELSAASCPALLPTPTGAPGRRLMQAAFTPKAIRGYLPRMQARALARLCCSSSPAPLELVQLAAQLLASRSLPPLLD